MTPYKATFQLIAFFINTLKKKKYFQEKTG